MLRQISSKALFLTLLLLHAFVFLPVLSVNRASCNTQVTNLLRNGSLQANDASVFYFGRYANHDGPVLTLPGCNKLCGSGWTKYDNREIGRRLFTWLVPILVLVGNMHLAAFGPLTSLCTIFHLLGDPIDSTWSLLSKIEVFRRSYTLARDSWAIARKGKGAVRDIATIVAVVEEVAGDYQHRERNHGRASRTTAIPNEEEMRSFSKFGDGTTDGSKHPKASVSPMASLLRNSDEDGAGTRSKDISMHHDLVNPVDGEPVHYFIKYAGSHMSEEAFTEAYQEAASELSDYRVNEAARTYLAILGYLVSISSAFIDAVDASSTASRPGNRIAFAVMFSWLIPAVLLSASIGGFPSRRSCHRILTRLNISTPGLFDHKTHSTLLMGLKSSEDDYFASQPWAGAIYSYRPQKSFFEAGSNDRGPVVLFALSILPIAVCTTGAFIISWVTPTVGLGCRSISELVIGLLWVSSASMTWMVPRLGLANGKYLWRILLVKNALIGTGIILWVLLIEFGVYNSCHCWSAVFSRGYSGAFVELNVQDELKRKAQGTYPGLAFGTLLAQFAVCALMRWGDGDARQLFGRDEWSKHQTYLALLRRDDRMRVRT